MIRLPAMLAFAFLANTGACNPVEVAIDCHAICSRYQTCFDKSYDLSKCETSCRSNSTRDADYRHKAETCSRPNVIPTTTAVATRTPIITGQRIGF